MCDVEGGWEAVLFAMLGLINRSNEKVNSN